MLTPTAPSLLPSEDSKLRQPGEPSFDFLQQVFPHSSFDDSTFNQISHEAPANSGDLHRLNQQQLDRQVAIFEPRNQTESNFLNVKTTLPKEQMSIYKKANLDLCSTRTNHVVHDLEITVIQKTPVWEYSIATVLETNDIEKTAVLCSDSEYDAFVCTLVPERKTNWYQKIFTFLAEIGHQIKKFCGISRKESTKPTLGKFTNMDLFHHGANCNFFPENFLPNCHGVCIYEKIATDETSLNPIVPEEFFLNHHMISASEKYVKRHNQVVSAQTRIIKRMQRISIIPVYEIACRKRGVTKTFHMVGTNQKLYYPEHN